MSRSDTTIAAKAILELRFKASKFEGLFRFGECGLGFGGLGLNRQGLGEIERGIKTGRVG